MNSKKRIVYKKHKIFPIAFGKRLDELLSLLGLSRIYRDTYAKGFNWHKKKKYWIEKDSYARKRAIEKMSDHNKRNQSFCL